MDDNEITSNQGDDEAYSDQVVVTDMRLLPQVGIDIIPGGCYQPGMIAHLQVVDVIKGVCYWIPVGRNALNALIGQATHCLELSDEARRVAEDQSP